MVPVIRTPVDGFTGTVAGVNFTDGVGESDDPAALLYFSGAGYAIRDEVPPAGTPLTPDELERFVQHEAHGGSGESPPDDSDEDSDDPGDDSEPTDVFDRPHPVQGSKAVWFEYLTKIKPDHGFDLETVSRRELIEASEEIEAQ